jgi:TrmH family RNA methyltransferase
MSTAIRKDELSLMLDDIHDPGNLGTMLRIADWFGITTVICSENCADAYAPKVVQASMGSLFRVNVFSQELEELLSRSLLRCRFTVHCWKEIIFIQKNFLQAASS